MLPQSIAGIPDYFWLVGAVFVAALLFARSVPILGTLINVAMWGVLTVVLVLAVDQYRRLDPAFGRLTRGLGADDQQVAGETMRVRMARDGHFWVRANIGGVERRMLVDSGATVTALSMTTAAAAGLSLEDAPFPVLIRTANGTVEARTATVPDLRFGNIVARNLAVVVSPAFGDVDVLGMNFLSRLKSWRVESRTLVLEPNFPQPVA